MAEFVEVSGYSQTDLDNAYQEGYQDGGGASLQGNASQNHVLQGYTFSSATAGVNKAGTMTNHGSINRTVNPGERINLASGYVSSLSVSGAPNIQVATIDSPLTDLGEQNRVRYVDASQYRADCWEEGKQRFLNSAVMNYPNTGTPRERWGTKFYGLLELNATATVMDSIVFDHDCILIFSFTAVGQSTSAAVPYANFSVTGATELPNSPSPSVYSDQQNVSNRIFACRVTAGSTVSATITCRGSKARFLGNVFEIY